MMKRNSNNNWSQKQKLSTNWFRDLRNQICISLESFEPDGIKFQVTPWSRGKNDDLGGGEMAMLHGNIFEKAGVHISTVYGELSDEFRDKVQGAEIDPRFWASGISVIIHPKNPHMPTVHMNTRMIVTTKGWFGGGLDLTPVLTSQRHADFPDTQQLHTNLKQACDTYDLTYYKKFKYACDKYFFLPHRNESRGTGGIFYDHLDSGDWEKDFAFTQDVGKTFLTTYPKIIQSHLHNDYTEEERKEQLQRRGRYVEFNLLYDRGTKFGLETGGNVESILSSLPPIVHWD